MHKFMTIWSAAAASLTVWRLSCLLFEEKGRGRIPPAAAHNILVARALDCVCWISIWLSAQTAVWVAGGLAGVVLNSFVLSHLTRLSTRSSVHPTGESAAPEAFIALRAHSPQSDLPCLAECGMQAHHG